MGNVIRFLVFVLYTGVAQVALAWQVDISPQQIWQDSRIDLKAGQTYRLSATGIWSFGGICGVADPAGAGNAGLCELGVKFVRAQSGAALVGRVGAHGEPFLIGHGTDFLAPTSGRLFVGPNVFDPVAGDNSGGLVLKVAVVGAERPPETAIADHYDNNPAHMDRTGPRIALVIGNGAYGQAPLTNPVHDAALIADRLQQLGFRTIVKTDLDQKSMKRAINRFGDILEDAGDNAVGFFYYAGHGVQVNGRNYLIPVTADIQNEKDVDIEAVDAGSVLAGMEYAGNGLNILVLDACRNNPYKRSFRSSHRGLARMDAPKGSLIAYSTGPGRVAADGRDGNSPYTRALAKAMMRTDLAIEQMFRQVRNQVMQETKDQQVPWEASSLTGGDFFFNPGK